MSAISSAISPVSTQMTGSSSHLEGVLSGEETEACLICVVRSLGLCTTLEGEELRRLSELVQTLHVEAGQTLFAEGDSADFLFVILSGTMRLCKLLRDGRRQIIGFPGWGDVLGMPGEEVYSCSAEAVTAVVFCRLNRRRLEALLENHPRAQHRLVALSVRELRRTQEHLVLLGRKTAREKMASFLLELSRQAGQRGQKENPVQVPMSRADIADFLGLTTETVSRTLTWLKNTRIISLLETNRIRINTSHQLQMLAEGESSQRE
jgi:CRP/FNR family transcriptional regulator